MKRRSFLRSALLVTAAATVPVCLSYGNKASDKETLFVRFFNTANGMKPNTYQLNLFNNYMSGKTVFNSPRRSGMTTFMLTLALFETKCNDKAIRFFPSNSYMHRHCIKLVRNMEDRLGKSIADANLSFHYNIDSTRDLKQNNVKTFIMSDAWQLPPNFDCRLFDNKSCYYFGTGASKHPIIYG